MKSFNKIRTIKPKIEKHIWEQCINSLKDEGERILKNLKKKNSKNKWLEIILN